MDDIKSPPHRHDHSTGVSIALLPVLLRALNTKLSHFFSALSTSRLIFSGLNSAVKDWGAYLSTHKLPSAVNIEE